VRSRAPLDSAALAVVFGFYRRHGVGRFHPPADAATRTAAARAVALGWLWEPGPGMLALTTDGMAATAPYRIAGDAP
jgi:hypothetical protein